MKNTFYLFMLITIVIQIHLAKNIDMLFNEQTEIEDRIEKLEEMNR